MLQLHIILVLQLCVLARSSNDTLSWLDTGDVNIETLLLSKEDRMVKRLFEIERENSKLRRELKNMKERMENYQKPAAFDCFSHLIKNPASQLGPQNINIGTRKMDLTKKVYCDMKTDGGGWTVIQRRFDGSINFFRNYESYAEGFGLNFHEFWIGNEILYLMTSRVNYEERVDVENYDGQTAFAKYAEFRVDSARNGYMLHIAGYCGTAGDSMQYHDGMKFTTYDKKQDTWRENCAIHRQGAWWYRGCSYANLNGMYLTPGTIDHRGMTWRHWFNDREHVSLKSVEMKIRPAYPMCPSF